MRKIDQEKTPQLSSIIVLLANINDKLRDMNTLLSKILTKTVLIDTKNISLTNYTTALDLDD